MSFLESLENTSFAVWVQSSNFGYYLLLVGHAIGMALVVGTVIVLTTRVLGFVKEQPLAQLEPLFGVAWAGFAVNLLTGIGLFMANARNLVHDVPFLIKISFIVLGGLCLQFLWRRLRQEGVILAIAPEPSAAARALACVTLGCWMMAIMAGRLIAYTISY